ncbi:hypothetical protein UPYG_G00203450 [Umbra pygmaea]|uniref:Uncharacterized protein n=1 Tax=Umbra pygmaea TaxID=75934 RepID=A0ABD0X6K7_UMBPY
MLQDLYDSKDNEHIRYVNWLRRQKPRNPGDPMEAALNYIKCRDQEAAGPPPPTAGFKRVPGPLNRAVTVGLGQPSVALGVSASRTARRPVLHPTEPSDAELVAAAIDTEESFQVQVPVQHVPAQPAIHQPQPFPDDNQVPRQTLLPPRPAQESAKLLPESWRAALNKDQQQWIGRVLFTMGSTRRSQLTTDLNLW